MTEVNNTNFNVCDTVFITSKDANALVDYSDSTNCSTSSHCSANGKDFSGCDSDESWSLPVKKIKRIPVFTTMEDLQQPSTSTINIQSSSES